MRALRCQTPPKKHQELTAATHYARRLATAFRGAGRSGRSQAGLKALTSPYMRQRPVRKHAEDLDPYTRPAIGTSFAGRIYLRS